LITLEDFAEETKGTGSLMVRYPEKKKGATLKEQDYPSQDN